jgi:hypothetical protein
MCLMRISEVRQSASGLGPSDHLCWGFADRAVYQAEARRFLLDGVELGQRVLYTASGTIDDLYHDLDGLSELERWIAEDRVELLPISGLYASARGRDAIQQADAYGHATRRALAAGFTGLRAVADATDLVREPAELDAFVRYEHRIDQLMASGLPFSAMCAYDLNRLGQDAVDELARVHPVTHGTTTPFRLHAGDQHALCLAGEFDAWDEADARITFERVLSAATCPVVTLDCGPLDFIHHRALSAMHDVACELEVEIHLVDPPSTVGPVLELLHLDSLRATTP